MSETVRGRLKTLVPDLAGIGLQSVGAVDIKGRLVARLGEREQRAGRVAGRHRGDRRCPARLPVGRRLGRGRARCSGWRPCRCCRRPATGSWGRSWVGAETGKRLAEVWKQNLGVDIAIMLRGQVDHLDGARVLPQRAARRRSRSASRRSSNRSAPGPSSSPSAPTACWRWRPPSWARPGSRAGCSPSSARCRPASNPLALLKTTTADDLRWGNFPWLGLAFVLIVILGVGLFLQRLETERPLGRLREEVQRLARGEVQKLDDTVHPGKFGGIARDVNAAMERYTLAPAPRSEAARKDVGAILGPAPRRPRPVSAPGTTGTPRRARPRQRVRSASVALRFARPAPDRLSGHAPAQHAAARCSWRPGVAGSAAPSLEGHSRRPPDSRPPPSAAARLGAAPTALSPRAATAARPPSRPPPTWAPRPSGALSSRSSAPRTAGRRPGTTGIGPPPLRHRRARTRRPPAIVSNPLTSPAGCYEQQVTAVGAEDGRRAQRRAHRGGLTGRARRGRPSRTTAARRRSTAAPRTCSTTGPTPPTSARCSRPTWPPAGAAARRWPP